MKRTCCIFLVLCIVWFSFAVHAEILQPQPDMAQDIFIKTTLTDAVQHPNLNRLQVMAALQVMTFSDKQIQLHTYMAEDEVLRVLFHIFGYQEEWSKVNEEVAIWQEFGLNGLDGSSYSDSVYLFAYQLGMIEKERFDAYFNTNAIAPNSVAMRYDVYLWMAKLSSLAPDEDWSKLSHYTDGQRIKIADKALFAALVNQDLVPDRAALNLYAPVTREWFLNTLERLEPYFISKMGYTKKEGQIQKIQIADEIRSIEIACSDGTSDIISVPLSSNDNQLAEDIAVLGSGGYQITAALVAGEEISYYVIEDGVAFIVVKNALSKPLTNKEVSVQGTLYYYDPDMRMGIIRSGQEYFPVFLASNVLLTVDGTAISPDILFQYYDCDIKVTAVMRYEHDILTAKLCQISQ